MAVAEEIRGVHVVLTAGCNLSCGYCYQNDKKPRHMDWETLRASADLLLGSLQSDVHMLFVGGEPLLEFPLIQRAVAYVEKARSPHLEVRYQIITNGTLLRDEPLAFFVEHDFEVHLSFDGIAPAQDVRGRGTFAILDHLLDRLREEHADFLADKVHVSLTLLPATIPHLADSVEYFLRKGVAEIAVSPAITHQAEWRAELMEELERQFARAFRASLRHFRRTGEIPLKLFRKEGPNPRRRSGGLPMCGVGRGERAAVDVDGQVHGCLMFVDSYQKFPTALLRTRLAAMRMGDLRDPEFPRRLAAYPAAARAAGLFHDKQEKYSSYGRCGECRFLTSCGVCPVSIGHQPGNADPNRIPDFLCAYNLVSLKYRERFPRQPGTVQLLTGRAPVPRSVRALLALAAPRGAKGHARSRP